MITKRPEELEAEKWRRSHDMKQSGQLIRTNRSENQNGQEAAGSTARVSIEVRRCQHAEPFLETGELGRHSSLWVGGQRRRILLIIILGDMDIKCSCRYDSKHKYLSTGVIGSIA